ncbi:MAG: CHC2 zinc finger domain-containing protein [Desulfobacteraceae bacterium]|nr:CHC2 zinc finger domain-containing protein [Desulfobacteraceae bacterium]
MSQYYPDDFLRMLRNDIPIDEVIVDLLNLEVQKDRKTIRFRCPLCYNFHTATNHKTNLARCFDCQKNFNPIDMVITVGNCGFVDAVKILKDRFNR